jgi:hypothetical protein
MEKLRLLSIRESKKELITTLLNIKGKVKDLTLGFKIKIWSDLKIRFNSMKIRWLRTTSLILEKRLRDHLGNLIDWIKLKIFNMLALLTIISYIILMFLGREEKMAKNQLSRLVQILSLLRSNHKNL